MKKKFLLLILILALAATVLGAFSIGASAEASAPQMSIAYCNLSFSDNVYIKYAVRSDVSDVKLLIWTSPKADYVIGTQDDEVTEYYTENIGGVPHMIFDYTELAAKQMADVVYARAYTKIDGVDYYSAINKYSILQYAYSKLGKTGTASTNAELKDLLSSMLSYGASAQKYFDYKENRLATADWYQIKVTAGVLSDGCNHGLYLPGDKVTLTAPEKDASGVEFAYWKDSAGNKVSTSNNFELTVGSKNEVYTPVYEHIHVAGSVAVENNVAADCVNAGSYDNVVYCATCGEELSRETVTVPATGHTAGDAVVENSVAADCVNAGSYDNVVYCVTCGEELSRETVMVPAYGHNFVDRTCTACGERQASVGLEFTSNGDGTCYVSGIGTCTDTDIVIPSTAPNGDSVTRIGYGAFRDCSSLTSVTIPDSVTSIGDYAFHRCTSLNAVYISDIAAWCNISLSFEFYYENPLFYAKNLYLNGELVTDLVIPDGVTRIGNFAFYNCISLTRVTIGNGVTSIGDDAFSGCTSLTSVTIGNGVTSIGDDAFLGCTSLTSVTIPDSVTSIGDDAFYNCTSLASVTIGNGVTSIGNYAFYNCISLTSVTIGNSVTSIGDAAFYHCTSLTSVTIPDSVTSIGYSAFSACTSLTSVTIPGSVTSIGNGAFSGCRSLACINVDGDNEHFTSIDGNLYNKNATTLIQYAIKKPDTGFTIPDSVTSIGYGAFYDCTSLTSVTIPDSVTSIGNFAFSGCYRLTSVTIPNGVTSIGDYVFSNCTRLTSVTIPDSVTSIGDFAFYDCTNLRNVTIPDSVTSIGHEAFSNCTRLASVTIGNGVKSIDDEAFYGCRSLTSINYIGTEAQWNAISKGGNWDGGTGDYVINFICKHIYDNDCDAACNVCGEVREGAGHDYADATCTEPKTCKVCGATVGVNNGHHFVGGVCTECDAKSESDGGMGFMPV